MGLGVRRVVVARGIPVDLDPAERETGGGIDRNVQDSLLIPEAFVSDVLAVAVEIEAAAHRIGDGRELLQGAGRERHSNRRGGTALIQRHEALDPARTHLLYPTAEGSLVPPGSGGDGETETGE